LVGRGADCLAMRLELADQATCLTETTLSVLRGLRRCGWRFRPHDADVVQAVAFYEVEAKNWRDYLADGSYDAEKCRTIIERYEGRLDFFHNCRRDWECAMQMKARFLARTLLGVPRNGSLSGRIPKSIAHRIAAFAVWELGPEIAEERPEPTEPVIEEITHEEDAAQIDPEVAHTAVQLEADERWADQVERGLAEPFDKAAPEPLEDEPRGELLLLPFGNAPRNALDMRAFRDALGSIGDDGNPGGDASSLGAASSNPTISSNSIEIRVGSKAQPDKLSLSAVSPLLSAGTLPSPGSLDHPDCWPCTPFHKDCCPRGKECHRCHCAEHDSTGLSKSGGGKRQRAAKQKGSIQRIRTPDPFDDAP